LVAGASAGMGKSSALALAHEGAEIYLSARGEERLIAATKEISDTTGVKVTPIIADHSNDCRLFIQCSRSQYCKRA